MNISDKLGSTNKINLVFFFLIACMALGFCLRVYNINSPSIGYHNMKENEYLSQAIHQYRDGDYLRRIQHIFGLDDGLGYFEEYPQMPILPWMFVASWKMFGVDFWSARIIIILFSVLTIPLIYAVAKKLSKNEYVSVLSAFFFRHHANHGIFWQKYSARDTGAFYDNAFGLFLFKMT